MNAQEVWSRFCSENNIEADYSAWAYGDDSDTLAQLTLAGIKTATASAYPIYALEEEDLPKAGEYSVILDSQDRAVCIVRTERVFVVPYEEVDERQAWKEGEGDRSLAYWRKVHETFFRAELAEFGLSFDEKMKVVCEEFMRVYP